MNEEDKQQAINQIEDLMRTLREMTAEQSAKWAEKPEVQKALEELSTFMKEKSK